MDEREQLTKLESGVTHLQSDMKDVKANIGDLRRDNASNFKWLLGVMILILGAMSTGYVSLNSRLNELATDLNVRQDKILAEVHALAVDVASIKASLQPRPLPAP